MEFGVDAYSAKPVDFDRRVHRRLEILPGITRDDSMSEPHILIIDDDKLIRTMLSDVCEEAGFRVTEAENGRDGLNLYLADPTDILITDIRMPEMEGLELIRTVRKSNPEAKIIAMSGGGQANDPQFLEMSAIFGATVIFPKPFDPDELVRAVHGLLKSDNSMPDQKSCSAMTANDRIS